MEKINCLLPNIPSVRLKKYFDKDSLDYFVFDRIDKEEIYHQIKVGKVINLVNCLIEDFSMSEYREKMGLRETDRVEIKFDCIIGCVFINENRSLDFDSCDFVAVDKVSGFDWEQNTFFAPSVSFEASSFTEGDVSFNGGHFFGLNQLSFAFTRFNKGDITFENCFFCDATEVLFVDSTFKEIDQFKFSYCQAEKVHCTFMAVNLNFNFLSFFESEIEAIRFENSVLGANLATFDDAEVEFFVMNQSTVNSYIRFIYFHPKFAIIQNCYISGCIGLFWSEVHPTKYSFVNSVFLGKLNFENRFSSDLFTNQKYLYLGNVTNRETNPEYNFSSFDSEYRDSPVTLLDAQFRVAASFLRSEGRLKEADEAYLEARRYERKAKQSSRLKIAESKKGASAFIKVFGINLAYLLEYLILDVFCAEYATKPFKFILLILSIISIFAVVLFGVRTIVLFDTATTMLAVQCFVDSAAIFFQINEPQNEIVEYIAIVEGLFGLVLMALFSASFIRRIII